MNSAAVSLALIAPSAPVGVLYLVTQAGMVVKLVMILLLFFSVFSWAIIGTKYFQVRRAQRESDQFLDAFWAGENMEEVYTSTKRLRSSPLVYAFQAGYQELNRIREHRKKAAVNPGATDLPKVELLGVDNVARALRQATTSEVTRLTRFLPFLATTGSTAPFIGLFGTVWGIMTSFQNLAAQHSAGLDVVAPGISEALVATAAGLAAAIPAVVAYNYYLSRIRVLSSELDNFSAEFLNIVERHFMKKI